jgi:hypothetical protein
MNLNLDYLISLNSKIISIINQISLSILILLFGFIIGKVLGKLTTLFFRKFSIKRIKLFSLNISLKKVIPSFISYLTYIAAIIISLNYSGILDFVVYIILFLFCVVIIFSVFASLKELMPNFVAYLKLKKNQNFKVHKKILIEDVLGEISKISISDIKIITKSGDEIHIPSKLFLKKEYKIIN